MPSPTPIAGRDEGSHGLPLPGAAVVLSRRCGGLMRRRGGLMRLGREGAAGWLMHAATSLDAAGFMITKLY
jgi:hypothetical protein